MIEKMYDCPYCRFVGGTHHPKCPNYIIPISDHYCSICQEGIQKGEYYIVNDDGDYAHWECLDYKEELVDFLGYKIKKMEEEK